MTELLSETTLVSRAMTTMPAQKPGRSKQDYVTPPEFIDAVLHMLRIQEFIFDLAADEANAQADRYYGPGSNWGQDSLRFSWHWRGGWCWLNPPFGNITPFAQKCAEHANDTYIALLVPASVGANWYIDYVAPFATVLNLQGRLSFDGKAPYPKDCVLALYGPGVYPSTHTWNWRKELRHG